MKDLWQPVYIALGSNLEHPVEQIKLAMRALGSLAQSRLIRLSALYESVPVGPPGQPNYVNAVVAMLTQLSPHALLDELQAIENEQGRTRDGQRWGPRTLDLDILMYADQCIDDDRLRVPHVELHKRDFVLGPWLELTPHVTVPTHGPVHLLAAALDMSNLMKLEN